jgi:hypothetical protein
MIRANLFALTFQRFDFKCWPNCLRIIDVLFSCAVSYVTESFIARKVIPSTYPSPCWGEAGKGYVKSFRPSMHAVKVYIQSPVRPDEPIQRFAIFCTISSTYTF